jgi:hypothetical protein
MLRFRCVPVPSEIGTPADTISKTSYYSISVAIYQLRTNFRQFFITASNKFQDFKSPFSLRKKEQAEAGRSPALLAFRYATGVLRILRGYLKWFLTAN